MNILDKKFGRIIGLLGAVVYVAFKLAPGGVWTFGRGAMVESFTALLGGGFLAGGFVLLRKKRLIENVPSSRIRSVAMGFSEIVGTAREREMLIARLSGMRCVYYRFKIEKEVSDSKGRRRWSTVEQGQSSQWFYLEDPTGRIVVDPEGADAVLRQSFQKIERDGGWFSRRMRYTEWRLIDGQRAYVLGTVYKLRNLAEESRVELTERLRGLKADRDRMKQFDTDKDGSVSAEEWQGAVQAVKMEMLKEKAAAPPEEPGDDLVIGKGSGETTFVIADRGEKSLVRMLAWKVAAAMLLGFILTMFGSVSLLARAGVLPAHLAIAWK